MPPKIIYLPCALGSRFLGPVGSILASWSLLGWILAPWGLMGWISWEPPALYFGFLGWLRASWVVFLLFLGWILVSGACCAGLAPRGTLLEWFLAFWGLLDWIQISRVGFRFFLSEIPASGTFCAVFQGFPSLPGPPKPPWDTQRAPEAFQGHSTPPRVSNSVLGRPDMQPGLPCNQGNQAIGGS